MIMKVFRLVRMVRQPGGGSKIWVLVGLVVIFAAVFAVEQFFGWPGGGENLDGRPERLRLRMQ